MQLFNRRKRKWLGSITLISTLFITQAVTGEPTTNSIPKKLFLTDNGFLFWYRKPGEKLININEIQKAQNSIESQPAEQDPQGHWGVATNGFQISLRLGKNVFTNGEPIMIVTLIRNITSQPQDYFGPVQIVVTKDGKSCPRKSGNEINVFEINKFPETTVFPQTQRRDMQDLCKTYDFSDNGEYLVQAASKQPSAASQMVAISVANKVRGN